MRMKKLLGFPTVHYSVQFAVLHYHIIGSAFAQEEHPLPKANSLEKKQGGERSELYSMKAETEKRDQVAEIPGLKEEIIKMARGSA